MPSTQIRHSKKIWPVLTVYAVLHGLVDLICAGIVYSIIRLQMVDQGEYFNLVLLYNILAFGAQPVLGLLVDYFHAPKLAALSGLILLVIALVVYPYTVTICVLLLGLGNALYHIGGGAISLNLTPKKATAPGIFVAPGAIGLLIGTFIGKGGALTPLIFEIILAAGAAIVIVMPIPKITYQKIKLPHSRISLWLIAVGLIFLAIALRALIGQLVDFPWKSQTELLVILTVAIAAGKGLGGWLADKFGWIKVVLIGLLVSIPLLVLTPTIPVLAITGIFIFNFTMPVTLVALGRLFPDKPAFAFGLTCLALLLGSVPIFLNLKNVLSISPVVLLMLLTACPVIFYGLQSIKKLKL